MSDDDYGFDDEFDEAALAAIAAKERSYVQISVQATHKLPPPKPALVLPIRSDQGRAIRPPPAKRVRSNDWTSTTNRDSFSESQDYPVVAGKDGKYRLLHSSSLANGQSFSLASPNSLVFPSQANENESHGLATPHIPQSQIPVGSQSANKFYNNSNLSSSAPQPSARFHETDISAIIEENQRLLAEAAQVCPFT